MLFAVFCTHLFLVQQLLQYVLTVSNTNSQLLQDLKKILSIFSLTLKNLTFVFRKANNQQQSNFPQKVQKQLPPMIWNYQMVLKLLTKTNTSVHFQETKQNLKW